MSSHLKESALALLKNHWGYDLFRENQWESISNALELKDTVVLLPTGGGKSICYQLPALVTGKSSIVVSPLLSLMEDQVRNLNSAGVKSIALNSNNTNIQSWNDAAEGLYSVVYVTPEALVLSWFETFLKMVENDKVCLVAIDEAHLVSSWSFFRPDYGKLSQIRIRLSKLSHLKKIPIMTLTATATRRVIDDIIKVLQLENPLQITSTYNRPNLFYSIRKRTTIITDLTPDVIGTDSCIIYCTKRVDTEEIADYLVNKLKIAAACYHAGLTNDVRSQVHQQFVSEKIQVIVATISFGIGIDLPSIYRIIHYGVSKALEEYVQQVGRCSRDGNPGECIAFINSKDIHTTQFLLNKETENKTASIEMFEAMKQYVYTKSCRRVQILKYFGEYAEEGKVESTNRCCDNCVSKKQKKENHRNDTKLTKQISFDFDQFKYKSSDNLLINDLKKFRNQEAERKKYAPYMIFSNKTIQQIVSQRPTTIQQLSNIHGMGVVKIKQFGKSLLSIIQNRKNSQH